MIHRKLRFMREEASARKIATFADMLVFIGKRRRKCYVLLGTLAAVLITIINPNVSLAVCTVLPGTCNFSCETETEASALAGSFVIFCNSTIVCGDHSVKTQYNQSGGGSVYLCNSGSLFEWTQDEPSCTSYAGPQECNIWGCGCGGNFTRASESPCANDPCCGSKDPCCGIPACQARSGGVGNGGFGGAFGGGGCTGQCCP
jgi:hypothetical protein